MATNQELDQRFEHAREAEDNGRYAEALSDYLYLFDYGRAASAIGGAGAVFSIAELSAHCPEARAAMLERRDRREQILLAGDGDYPDLSEVSSINEYFGEKNDNLRFLEQLKNAGPKFSDLYQRYLHLVWKDLAAQRQYQLLQDIIEGRAQHVVAMMAHWQAERDFSSDDENEDQDGFMEGYSLPEAVLAYEVLIGLKKDAVAAKTKKWVLKFEQLTEAPALFQAADLKAGHAGFL